MERSTIGRPGNRSNSGNYQQGFTLIEVIITVSIVMILASIAFPRYNNFLTKSHRSDGHHLLLSNSLRLQRCLTLSGSYDVNCPLKMDSAEGYYRLRDERTAQSWQLTAVPTKKGGQDKDNDCASLELTNAGLKTATGKKPDNCW